MKFTQVLLFLLFYKQQVNWDIKCLVQGHNTTPDGLAAAPSILTTFPYGLTLQKIDRECSKVKGRDKGINWA